ncbi:MAG: LysR family transcriptional regulator [Phyllobacterium sp.]
MITLQRRLMPSTSALCAFDAVARLGSFTAAAKDLSLTQGAISRHVHHLEQQLGVALLERTSRSVTLTPEGETYAQDIAEALRIIRTASLRTMTDRHRGSLNLAMLPTFGTRWLMPRIPKFVAAHPEIVLSFATRIGQFDFDRDDIDATIHIGQPDWPSASSTFLMPEQVAPICSPAYLQEQSIRIPADLARCALLHMKSRPGAWDRWFAAQGLTPPEATGMHFEQFSTVFQACIAGLGVALLPLFLIASELESGQMVKALDIPVESPSAYYFVTPKRKENYAPVALFRDWLIAEIKADSSLPHHALSTDALSS